MKIKCISLWEPWASAMARHLKRNETRSWATSYRGPLAIHAAKKPFDQFDYEDKFVEFLRSHNLLSNLGYGNVLCIVDLVKCTRTELVLAGLSRTEEQLGDYSPQRFALETTNLRVLPFPVPLRGQQRLFDWAVPPELEQLAGVEMEEGGFW